MINIHYSWWLFHKINQKSLNKDIGHKVRTISRFMDIMLKKKVIHLSTIHGNTFEIPPIFFQQANCNILLQKEVVLLTITFQSYWGKNPFLLLRFLLLYKRSKWLGCPKWPLGFPTFFSPNASFLEKFYKNIKLLQSLASPLWGGSRLAI